MALRTFARSKADPGTWRSATDATYSYVWQRCDAKGAACAAIPHATQQTYVLTRDDAGKTVRVLVMLGTRLDAGEADDLAAQLPESVAACVSHEGTAERFPPSELERRVARVVPLSNEQAPKAARAVFATLAEAITQGELEHVAQQLGSDYEALIGTRTT